MVSNMRGTNESAQSPAPNGETMSDTNEPRAILAIRLAGRNLTLLGKITNAIEVVRRIATTWAMRAFVKDVVIMVVPS